MRRLLALSLAVGFCLATPAWSQEEIVGKFKVGEWLKILREEKEPNKRYAAIIAMEVFGAKNKVAVLGLIEALEKDPDIETRREVARTLGRMGPDAKGAAEALGDALKSDKSELVREAAAKALGGKMAEKGHSQVLALGAALRDKHAGTRVAAAESLRDLGEKARAALEPLLEIVKNKEQDRFSRLYAAQAIGKFADDVEKTGPVLIEVVKDTSAHISVREAAIESLGRLKFEDAIPALGNLLEYFPKDSHPIEIRRAAAVALMKMSEKTKSIWPTIEKALKSDPDATVRSQSIRLAGGLGREESGVVPALKEACVKDASPENRLAAIQELGALGRVAADAKDLLTTLMNEDARQTIRDAAAAALKKINASD